MWPGRAGRTHWIQILFGPSFDLTLDDLHPSLSPSHLRRYQIWFFTIVRRARLMNLICLSCFKKPTVFSGDFRSQKCVRWWRLMHVFFCQRVMILLGKSNSFVEFFSRKRMEVLQYRLATLLLVWPSSRYVLFPPLPSWWCGGWWEFLGRPSWGVPWVPSTPPRLSSSASGSYTSPSHHSRHTDWFSLHQKIK